MKHLKTRQRIISFLLGLIMALLLFWGAVPIEQVEAATSYSVSASLSYAKSHWNDGQGKCAEFVSRCVKAGGLNIPVKTTTYECYNAICNATGLTGQNLVLNANGYPTYASNKNILAAGDVVIQWCYTCNLRPHILICGGYNSNGIATFYAHNAPKNNGVYPFKTHELHKSTCNIGAKVIHLSSLDKPVATGHNPEGVIDYIEKRDGKIYIQGWVFDRDSLNTSLQVHVYMGGATYIINANKMRSDVHKVYGVGNYHGFSTYISTSKVGAQDISVYAINVGGGANVLLGKKRLTVGYNPEGVIDAIVGKEGAVQVRGWAFDRDMPGKELEIHVNIGNEKHVAKANVCRDDVNKVYGMGKNHGFWATLSTKKTGVQPVSVYAINVGNGENIMLGCATVTILPPEGKHTNSVSETTKNSNEGGARSKSQKVSNLKVRHTSSTSLSCTWKKGSNSRCYIILYDGKKKVAAKYEKGSSCTFNNLKPSTVYTIKVFPCRTETGKPLDKKYAVSIKTGTNPSAVQLKSLKKAGNKRIKLKWKKLEGVNGYDIYMKTGDESFKKIKTITKGTITSFTQTGLKKGRTYTVKIRAFKKIDGKKKYGNYSKAKKIKL